MKRLEDLVIHSFDATSKLHDETNNHFHKHILRVWWRHALLEGAGMIDEITDETMMSDHPVYHVNWGKSALVVDGKEAVMDFYRNAATDVVMYHTDNLLSVADWGVADELTFHYVGTGAALAVLGYDTPDENRYYDLSSRQVFLWPFDERARVKGEHLYEDKTSIAYEEVSESDLITPETAMELNKQALRALEDRLGPEYWIYRP